MSRLAWRLFGLALIVGWIVWLIWAFGLVYYQTF